MDELRRELEAGSQIFEETDTEKSAKVLKDENKERLKARNELLRLIKSYPNWQRALKVPSAVKDVEIIAQLARADSPRATLRAAGCTAIEATQAATTLLPLALEFKAAPLRKRCWQKIGCRALCTGFFVLCAIVCFLGFLYYLVLEKAGWKVGKCNIIQFSGLAHDETCNGKCLFDITVKAGQGSELLKMYDFSPALAKDNYRSGSQVTLRDDVFRCCDMQDCCSFMDENHRFCDNWPDRTSPEGEACPDGNWQCLYKTGDDSESKARIGNNSDASSVSKVVKELRPDYETPLQRVLLILAIVLFCVALLVFVLGYPPVYHRIESCLAHTFAKIHLWVDEEERQRIDDLREKSRPEIPKNFQRQKSVMVDSELISQFAKFEPRKIQSPPRSSVLSQPRRSSTMSPTNVRDFGDRSTTDHGQPWVVDELPQTPKKNNLRRVADNTVTVEDYQAPVEETDMLEKEQKTRGGMLKRGWQSLQNWRTEAKGQDKLDKDLKEDEDIEHIVAYDSVPAPSGSFVSSRSGDEVYPSTMSSNIDKMGFATAPAGTGFFISDRSQTLHIASGRTLKEIAEDGQKNGYGSLFRPIITPPTRAGTRGLNSPMRQTGRSVMSNTISTSPTSAQPRTNTQQQAFPLATIDNRSPTGFRLQKRIKTDDPTKWGWADDVEDELEDDGVDRLSLSPSASNCWSSSQTSWHPAVARARMAAAPTAWAKPATADTYQRGRSPTRRPLSTSSAMRSKVVGS